MTLPSRSFTQFVQDMAAVVQGKGVGLVDLSVGSVLRSLLEANASLALWIQWLILRLLQATRAATCSGSDLDSWMGDFSLSRLTAVPSRGEVTFTRYTPIVAAVIPVGTILKTADGLQSFEVTADNNYASWSTSSNGFIIPAGASAATVPVVAQVSGGQGNVQAASVSVVSSVPPGIDNVCNANALAGGTNAETDQALRTRFQNFLSTRSRATLGAVGYSIQSFQQGLQYIIQENVDTTGAPRPGSFVVIVDDGTGVPSTSLISNLASVINQVRPVGSVFSVLGPTVVVATISVDVTLQIGYQLGQTVGTIVAAISSYVNCLPIGASLFQTRIAQVAYASSGVIENVSSVLINGRPADLIPPPHGVIKAATIVVS